MAFAQFFNISTIAGNGLVQFQGGSQAVNTVLIVPAAVALDASGNNYVSDTYFNQVFPITPGGVISVYAGNGQPGFSGDGGPATAAQLSILRGLAVEASEFPFRGPVRPTSSPFRIPFAPGQPPERFPTSLAMVTKVVTVFKGD